MRLWFLLGLTFLATGCATPFFPQAATRETFLQAHPEVPTEFSEAIRVGRVEAGMTPEMVRAAYGWPGMLKTRGNPSTSGVWAYFTCTDAVSQARSLQSNGLVPRIGTMTTVHFENGTVTHLKTRANVSEYDF